MYYIYYSNTHFVVKLTTLFKNFFTQNLKGINILIKQFGKNGDEF